MSLADLAAEAKQEANRKQHLLSGLVRGQLTVFAMVTVLALTVMAAYYVRIPEMLGIGRYDVKVQLPDTGGLYPKSVVTYRGHEVGTVEKLGLRGTQGVEADISIDNGVEIPRGSRVEVRSASVIGEQYLNFAPDSSAGRTFLRDGDVVPADLVTIPVSTSQLLDSVNTFLQSIPVADLRTTINELGAAFAGDGQQLGQVIDQASSLQRQATANLAQTLDLIRTAAPVLATQQAMAPDFRSWTTDLASLTGQLSTSDAQLRQILTSAKPLAGEANRTFTGLAPVLPGLLGDLSNTAQVLQVYVPALEHVLVVFPASIEALQAGAPKDRLDDPIPEINMSFKLNLGNPPICTKGFPLAGHPRSPQDLSQAPLPPDSYCTVAHDDPRVPRGARNQKCPNAPDRYGPTAASCGLVFQKDVVAAQRAYARTFEPLGVSSAVYDDRTGQLIAPNGQFYLLDSFTRSTPYAGIGDLMDRLTTP